MSSINWADEIKSAVKKILHKGVKALENNETNKSELIHDSRKRVKNIRAILKLIQGEVGQKDFKQLNNTLRNLNRKSANIRRVYVMLDIIENESKTNTDYSTKKMLTGLKQDIESEMISLQPKININRMLTEYTDSFHLFEGRVSTWNFERKNFSLIKDGLTSIYSQGRELHKNSTKTKEANTYHEWRKNAKDLLYAFEILRKSWSPILKSYNREIKILTEYIGEMHDLYEFKITILKNYSNQIVQNGNKENLVKRNDERISYLMRSADVLGEKIYAEKTKCFISRIKNISRIEI